MKTVVSTISAKDQFFCIEPITDNNGRVCGISEVPIVSWVIQVETDEDGRYESSYAFPVTTEPLDTKDRCYVFKYPNGEYRSIMGQPLRDYHEVVAYFNRMKDAGLL